MAGEANPGQFSAGAGTAVVEVAFPRLYTWFVFLAAMDVMMTAIVLHFGGFEANALAAWVIEHGDKWGTLGFKFAIVALVLCLCEWVGRLDRGAGLRLATAVVVIQSLPVLAAFLQLG